eukprot:517042_1
MSLTEKEWLIPASTVTVHINEVFSCLAFIHNCVIFIWIAYQNYKSLELPSARHLGRSLLIWTLLAIGSYILHSLGLLVSSMNSFHCMYQSWYMGITYWLSKYTIWMFSIVRIKIVFHDSLTLAYSPNLLLFFQAIFHVILVSNICCTLWGPTEKVIYVGTGVDSV